jgi:hypothetical protein
MDQLPTLPTRYTDLAPDGIRSLFARIRAVHLGVDLGQAQDFSAVALVEVGEVPAANGRMRRDWRAGEHFGVSGGRWVPDMDATYRVQRLMRLDLGTSYVAVAGKIAELVGNLWDWERGLRERGELQPHDPQLSWDIWADATGVGRPVMELISNALAASSKTDRAQLHPVVFTHGDRFTRGGYEQYGDVLGKAYLVSRLQVLFQEGRVKLPPRDGEAAAMAQELKDYKVKVDENANDKYGAFAVGAHDDLVTALGLACIEEPGYYTATTGPRIW